MSFYGPSYQLQVVSTFAGNPWYGVHALLQDLHRPVDNGEKNAAHFAQNSMPEEVVVPAGFVEYGGIF